MKTHRFTLSLLAIFILFASSHAQQGFGTNSSLICGTDHTMQAILLKDTSIAKINQQIELLLLRYKELQQRPLNPLSVITLPVVIHIIHNNGVENISNARVLAGIQHLNEAYANTGYYDPSSGVNTNIQFCLAQRDPNGQATTGISRNVSSYTNMGGAYYDSDDINVKNINRWDPGCYINIWLVNDIPGSVAGYAYLPAAHATNVDGILMEAAYFGSSNANDVVIIHEMGHYLGLYHTFEQGCSNNECTTDGDKVCDTPPDNSTAVTSCNLTVNSCSTDALSGFTTDQNDLTQDYLDYGNWNCMSVFTQGQADRMNWFVQNVRSSLLNCGSCLPPCPLPVTANFTSSTRSAPAGTNVSFNNTSLNGSTYSWLVNGTLVSTAFNYNQLFTQTGTYIVKLIVQSNNPGLCLAQQKADTITITCLAKASFTPGYNGVATIGQNIVFTNTSTNANSYEWFYDNKPNGISTDYTAVFSTLGIHYIKLKATSNYCSDSISVYYVANAAPAANFSFQKQYYFPGINSGYFKNNPCLVLPDQTIIQIGGDWLQGNIVVKLTESGNTLWSKEYINDNDLYSNGIDNKKVLLTNDGNLIFLGDTHLLGSTSPQIMKTDFNGNIIWQKAFYEPANVASIDILELPDGSYIISGDYYYGYLIFYKIDANGQLLWRKSLAYNGFNFKGASLQFYNNEIYIASNINAQSGVYNWDGLLLKLNPANADILFSKRYDYKGGPNWFSKIRQVGNKLVIEGCTNTIRPGPSMRTLLTIDANDRTDFKVIDFPNIGVTMFDADLFINANNEIILALPEVGTFDSHLLILDSSLSFIKGSTYPQTVNIAPNNIAQFSNGDYLLSETMSLYQTALVRTLPDLSVQPCNSFDFFPSVKSDTLIETDILGTLAYSNNFPQRDTMTKILIQDRGIGSTTDCIKIIDPICDTSICNLYRLSAPGHLCNLNDTLEVILNKKSGCNLIPNWTISGKAGFHIVSQTDSLVRIKITSAGNISVKVKSISSCAIFEDSLVIDVNISPAKIDLGKDILLCSSSTIQLHAGTGFTSYLWQDGSVDSTFTAFLPGTYYVTANDECGNQFSDSINISLAPAAPFDLGPDTSICANDSIILTAPSGFSDYKWSPDYFIDTAYGPTVKLWPAIDTIYTVTAIKGPGCSVLDSIRIKVHPVKKINLGTDTSFCQGGSIILDAGPNFNLYKWSTGSVNQSIIGSVAQLYSVVAIDANGCSSRDTLIVRNIYPNPTLNLGFDKNICENDSLVLDAGIGFKSYQWQDKSINQTFIAHTTGQYWLQVRNNQNCIANDTINILKMVSKPVINLGADTSFCEGQSILLTPGAGFVSYDWQDHSVKQSFTAFKQGQYSVLVTNTDNCSAADTLNIIALYPSPLVDIGSDTFVCKGQSITLNAGNGFASYLWQDNSSNQYFTASVKGSYIVKVSNAVGCFTIDTLQIINLVIPPVNFVALSYTICENASLFIKPLGSFSSLLWSNGSVQDSVLISAPGNYSLTAKDAYGCATKETFEVVAKNCITALYFPNSFSPNNDNLNETFRPTLFGSLEQYRLTIYNRYGKKVFESENITNGWNGEINLIHQNSGAYIWICTFKLKNQARQVQKGTLLLLR